ncbi:MAG: amidohydrolase, partial [Litorimonas sp.]
SRAGGSRGAAIQQLRSAIDDARRSYLQHVEGDVFQRRDARAFRQVVSGDMPLMISASRASDLLRIIRIKQDVPALDIIVIGAEEAHLVADDLAEAGIRVVVDPLENLPDNFDSVNASFDNVVVLEEAGVEYAIGGLSSLGVVKAGGLAQHAGNAVAQGLPYAAAIQAITTTPASWFGVDLGERRVGADATMVVWDGDPLEVTSAPIALYMDGDEVTLSSRMTALRDRYNPALEDDRPYKYR